MFWKIKQSKKRKAWFVFVLGIGLLLTMPIQSCDAILKMVFSCIKKVGLIFVFQLCLIIIIIIIILPHKKELKNTYILFFIFTVLLRNWV